MPKPNFGWTAGSIPENVDEWLRSLPDEAGPAVRGKAKLIAVVLCAQDQNMPDHYQYAEAMWEDLAIPIAYRQLELEQKLEEQEQAWAKRLNEMQDGIERAVFRLNEVTAEDDGTFQSSDALHEALAELNKVL